MRRWRKMTVNMEDNIVRVVVLDISGIYVQIHDQGYFHRNIIEDIKKQYSDMGRWRVLVLD